MCVQNEMVNKQTARVCRTFEISNGRRRNVCRTFVWRGTLIPNWIFSANNDAYPATHPCMQHKYTFQIENQSSLCKCMVCDVYLRLFSLRMKMKINFYHSLIFLSQSNYSWHNFFLFISFIFRFIFIWTSSSTASLRLHSMSLIFLFLPFNYHIFCCSYRPKTIHHHPSIEFNRLLFGHRNIHYYYLLVHKFKYFYRLFLLCQSVPFLRCQTVTLASPFPQTFQFRFW